MYTLKITHNIETREFWQFMAIIDQAQAGYWEMRRYPGQRNSNIRELKCENLQAMLEQLDRYGIGYTVETLSDTLVNDILDGGYSPEGY